MTHFELGPVDQFQKTFAKGNRTAAGMGTWLGALVPAFSFWVAHYEHPVAEAIHNGLPYTMGDFVCPQTALVVAALAFSAQKVYGWAKTFLDNKFMALCYVTLIEAGMLVVKAPALAWAALLTLIAINGVTMAANIALNREKRQEAIKAEKKAEKAEKDAAKAAEKAARKAEREAKKAEKPKRRRVTKKKVARTPQGNKVIRLEQA